MALDLSAYEHPTWLTALGTGAGYLAILGLMTVALFLVPWALFATL
ncbi:hypothetical protein ACFQMM_16730 [Saliphagus sp. GCM10025308]|uniref:Uncharacterized protein n=1 Tax=Natronosalvus rutilus TaxID=2953753 RepID=A0A9E7N8I8_9EURY|nr:MULTISPECIES: hypothetical protein [Natronosalvus]USZ70375.1 hypothetical protein NGM15_09600 [Natronosalvus halobius]UTF53714.1 hypothetical protein NGM29_00010 [Natronosalvus rutilus]